MTEAKKDNRRTGDAFAVIVKGSRTTTVPLCPVYTDRDGSQRLQMDVEPMAWQYSKDTRTIVIRKREPVAPAQPETRPRK